MPVQDRLLSDPAASVILQRLDLRTRIGWTLSAMPELMKSFAWEALVLFYYSQVLGLKGSLIGAALLIILVTDALIDPYVGALSDRLRRAPLGPRHTLMVAAVLPFAIGIAAVFSPPAGLTQIGLFAWLLGFGVLARVSISFYTVPVFALGAELSRDERERSLIATLRNFGSQSVLLILPFVAFGFFFVPSPEYPRGQLNPAPYPWFGIFIATSAALLMLIGAFGTLRRARQVQRSVSTGEDAHEDSGLLAMLRRFRNAITITPNVGRLLIVTFLVLVVQSTVAQLSLHLATYFWKLDAPETQRLFMAATVGSLLAFLTAPWLTRRVSRPALMLVGLGGFFGILLISIVLPLLSLAAPPGGSSVGLFVTLCRLLAGFAYGIYVVPFNAIIFDIADEHSANTGVPQQGTVGAFMFIGIQAGSGVVGLLTGFFLDLIQFPVGQPVELVPEYKVTSLALFVAGITAVAGPLLLWIVSGFRVSKEKQAAVNARLVTASSEAS